MPKNDETVKFDIYEAAGVSTIYLFTPMTSKPKSIALKRASISKWETLPMKCWTLWI